MFAAQLVIVARDCAYASRTRPSWVGGAGVGFGRGLAVLRRRSFRLGPLAQREGGWQGQSSRTLRWCILASVPALECVPNVSEGRRPDVVARLAAAVSVPGVQLLDVSSDPDHNRTVLTLAGEPEDLIPGLLALYETALAEIDLRRHAGVHPRIGAVDVVPFVPLGETSMAVAGAAARRLATAVGSRFGLPVYLYEEAAACPERRSLAS